MDRNFGSGIIRLIYFIFILLYPVAILAFNFVVGNNLRRHVLKESEEDPNNAEFLDFEDSEEDILRKAKVLAVRRKVNLYWFAMTPLTLSGFFKIISERDFSK